MQRFRLFHQHQHSYKHVLHPQLRQRMSTKRSRSHPTSVNATSMFFTPSYDNACQQSGPGVTQPQSMLQLRPGICQTNSYPFQSFLISTGQNGIQQDCSLGLFEENQCAGGTREVPLDDSLVSTGHCWFVGGQSVMLSCGEGGGVSDNQGTLLT
jgi:hypothetical protein